MQLHAQRCLVIPDVHQDIAWVERILTKEDSEAAKPDLVVFLGDYFDSRRSPKEHAGVAATCAYLEELRDRLGDRVIFLLGNHDVQYREARRACLARRTPRNLRYQCGAAFSHSAARQIAKHLSARFWSASRLSVIVNGWLLSHAGLSPRLLPFRATANDSLAALEQLEAEALQSIASATAPHPLLQAGLVRGGDAPIGGITWLDWDDEFEDALPLPQLVGHTLSREGARQHGRSWCLDGAQTCYGVLTEDFLQISHAD
jgi:hypothetical protein